MCGLQACCMREEQAGRQPCWVLPACSEAGPAGQPCALHAAVGVDAAAAGLVLLSLALATAGAASSGSVCLCPAVRASGCVEALGARTRPVAWCCRPDTVM